MNSFFKRMTFEEFKRYCNERACDGKWGLEHCMECLKIIDYINSIDIKLLGIRIPRKSKEAREKAWVMFKECKGFKTL